MTNFRTYNKAELLPDGRIRTPWFRASFVEVFEPKQFKGQGEPKYSICMIFDEAQVDLTAMKTLATEKVQGRFGSNVPKGLKNPFRDGTAEKDDEAFEGMTFVNATSKFSPGKIDQRCSEITDQTQIYSGCYMRATLSCYAYDNIGKGVAFGLQNLQLLADGEVLSGGGASAVNDFGEVEVPVDDSAGNNSGGEQSGESGSIF